MNRQSHIGANLALFWLLTAAFSAVVVWSLRNNFVSDPALRYWAKLVAVLDGAGFRLENFGALYPHGTFYPLIPFHFLGPLDSAAAPHLVSLLFAAGLLVLWNHHLRQAGHTPLYRAALMGLVALHPAFLWGATSGSLGSLSLLFFYLLYVAALRMVTRKDIHSYILLGVVLALFFFVDEVMVYLFLALLPLLALLVQRAILVSAPASVYVILGTPLVVVILGWLYFNWIFFGSPLAFLGDPRSEFLGGRHLVEETRWLRSFGGTWLVPGAIATVLTLVSYPVIALLLGATMRQPARFSAAVVLLMHPIIAVALATYDYFLRHPLEIVSLVVAGVMAELIWMDSRSRNNRWAVTLLLGLGVVGGWGSFLYQATPPMRQWVAAIAGTAESPEHLGDIALGRWLADHRALTLLDDRTGFRAIAARGDARGLILPFSDQFKIELRRDRPTAEMVAVPDPQSAIGGQDAINRRWPDFYGDGMRGYRLEYDYDGWHVWIRAT